MKIDLLADTNFLIYLHEGKSFIEPFLDEGKIVPVDYQLEVSSPGMSNPLKVPMQYIKRIGRTLEITTTKGIKHTAILKHADDEKIIIEEIIELKKNKKQLVKKVRI